MFTSYISCPTYITFQNDPVHPLEGTLKLRGEWLAQHTPLDRWGRWNGSVVTASAQPSRVLLSSAQPCPPQHLVRTKEGNRGWLLEITNLIQIHRLDGFDQLISGGELSNLVFRMMHNQHNFHPSERQEPPNHKYTLSNLSTHSSNKFWAP